MQENIPLLSTQVPEFKHGLGLQAETTILHVGPLKLLGHRLKTIKFKFTFETLKCSGCFNLPLKSDWK